jgi:hypothetical protein
LTGSKLKSAIAVVAAVLAGLVLLPVSYLLTPQPNQNPLPMPVPSVESQIFAASLWIGFAVLVSVSAVGVFVLVQRVGKRNRSSV